MIRPFVKGENMNAKKILLILIAVVVMASCVALGYFIAKNPAENSGTTSTSYENSESAQESSVPQDEDKIENTEQNSETPSSNAFEAESISDLLLGAWTDNANFSGYEFFENNTMKVTYFNMASIGLEDVIEGTYSGTYTLNGDELTVSYTIYSKAVTKSYKVKVDENTLTLADESGDEAIYVRKDSSSKMENADSELLGAWSSNLSGYEFKDTGVVTITYIDLSSIGINLPISGKVDGIYTLDGDKITIKYSIYSGVIEKNYKYSVNGDTLTLTDLGNGDKGVYIRKK